jgi:hypothetical protein
MNYLLVDRATVILILMISMTAWIILIDVALDVMVLGFKKAMRRVGRKIRKRRFERLA